jgi:hypothetical protein
VFKRLFFAMLGLGVGLLVGTWVVRKAEHTQAKYTPGAVGSAAAGKAGTAGSRLSAALTEGRRAASQREAELRAVYRGGRTGQSSDQPPGA